jgi:hypothetical protein
MFAYSLLPIPSCLVSIPAQMNIVRTYALYKLTIMCMNDIWSFQALRMKSR